VLSMSPQRPRINYIIERIFGELKQNEEKTITDIVKETKFHHNTVRGYLEMIEYIQSQPKLTLKRTGHSYLASLKKPD